MNSNNFEQIPVTEFKKEIGNSDTTLIDIRTPMEWKMYWIIPDTDKYIVFWSPNFEAQISELDKNKKYLIYCFHWNRTLTARNFMQQIWFSWVKDLQWWINAWHVAGENIGKKQD